MDVYIFVRTYNSHVYLKLFQPPETTFPGKVFHSLLGARFYQSKFFIIFLLFYGRRWVDFSQTTRMKGWFIFCMCGCRFQYRINCTEHSLKCSKSLHVQHKFAYDFFSTFISHIHFFCQNRINSLTPRTVKLWSLHLNQNCFLVLCSPNSLFFRGIAKCVFFVQMK